MGSAQPHYMDGYGEGVAPQGRCDAVTRGGIGGCANTIYVHYSESEPLRKPKMRYSFMKKQPPLTLGRNEQET